MPRRKNGQPPSYRLHKQSGQAIVSLPIGGNKYRDLLLGPHGMGIGAIHRRRLEKVELQKRGGAIAESAYPQAGLDQDEQPDRAEGYKYDLPESAPL